MIPDIWKTALIVRLPKKGDLGLCNNWRGVVLLSITCKVFSRVIFNRISLAVGPLLYREKVGFRKGKSCNNQFFTLRQILEQSHKLNTPVYTNFIDFEKGFDSVRQESLWAILRYCGIPAKIVSITQLMYSDLKSKVICGSCLSEEFEVKTGVKQDCILSALLFSLSRHGLAYEGNNAGRTERY